MRSKSSRPYGSWISPITPEFLTKETVGLSALQTNSNSLFWIERRPHEEGREVIVQYKDSQTVDLLPSPYSASTRVHEYGGGSYCVNDHCVYFVNARDQNVYCATLADEKSIQQITEGDNSIRFADLVVDSGAQFLYCVRERHGVTEEAINDIVKIHIESGDVTVIAEGHDFYASPRLSPNNHKLACIAWDHPNMPFNGTQLLVFELGTESSEGHEPNASMTVVAGGSEESIVQPKWITDDRLLFASDRNDFWNLHIYDDSGIYCIAEDDAEYATAQWQFGGQNFETFDERFIVASRYGSRDRQLVVIDSMLNVISPLCSTFSAYGSIGYHKGNVVFIGGSEDNYDAVLSLDPKTTEVEIIKRQSTVELPREWMSSPDKLEFPNPDNDTVYAYFYPPSNPEYEAPSNQRPPLLVMSHGGPTASTNSSLSLTIQFYTSRGWAVLDVDYGGSTGYGRDYRDRLKNTWGITDVVDCESGVRYLIGKDLIDPKRVAIVGGSAGGYTTLRALTTSSLFSAGASHYGVSDVRALAEDTHKFESQYIDQLIPPSEWDSRSPMQHIEHFSCPVVFFQGADDMVVPQSQAKEMFKALTEKGLFTMLFVYAEERHGFRKAANIQTTIIAQYRFFSHVFGFETPGIDDTCFEQADVANAAWH